MDSPSYLTTYTGVAVFRIVEHKVRSLYGGGVARGVKVLEVTALVVR